MVSQEEIFQDLQNLEENKYCFECRVKSNSWASVNNGIFLCLKCSGAHRGLGTYYSFIRSINLDSWNEKQINYMRNGGNGNLQRFFEKYKISASSPLEFKFKTKAAHYYREKLKSIVEGEEFLNDPPSLEEGLEIYEIAKVNPSQYQNFNSNSQYEPILVNNPVQEKKGFDKFKDQMAQFYDKTAESAKTTFSSLNTKIKNAHIGDDIKSFGHKVADKSKELGEAAGKKAKEGVSNIKEYFNKKNDKKSDISEESKDPSNEKNEVINDEQKQSPINENLPKNENKKEGNAFSKGFNSFLNSTKSAFSKVNQKFEDPEFKKKMADFKEKVSVTTKQIGDKTSELAKKSYNGIKEGIEKIKDKKKDKSPAEPSLENENNNK